MRLLRQRFASCALALVVCQAAIVFAAPLSSCCPSKPHAVTVQEEKECCPAGSHAPGQCPRHGRSASRPDTSCRMLCDAPHGAQFVLGAVALLPAPAAAIPAPLSSSSIVLASLAHDTRPFVPESPPPRIL
jgi:hypothetical protein